MFRMIVVSAVLSAAGLGAVRLLVPDLLRTRGRLILWGAVIALHAAWYWVRANDVGGPTAFAVHTAISAWIVTVLIAVFLLGPIGLGRRLLAWRRRRQAPDVDLARRRFLGGAALPVAALTTGAGGTLAGMRPFTVREVEMRLPGLPPALEGFRIGQITDVHIGVFIDTAYLEGAVEAMNEAGCDLQVMTGDLIDDMSQLDATMAALDRCRARHGMLAVLGNHEKWGGEAEVLAAYERIAANGRVKLLVDENVRLDHDGTPLWVVGVDYPMEPQGRHRLPPEQHLAKMRSSAERGFAGVEPGETVLCLTHHPDFFDLAAERGAGLTLAGHTHGGQVGLLGRPLFFFAFAYMLGRYRRGDAQLYVSGGTGHWLPFRVGVPTEVTVLTLRAA